MGTIKITENNFKLFLCSLDEEYADEGEGKPHCIGKQCADYWDDDPNGFHCEHAEFTG